VRDDEGQLKVAGYGSLNLIKVSEDKLQMAQPVTQLDSTLHSFTMIFAFAKKVFFMDLAVTISEN